MREDLFSRPDAEFMVYPKLSLVPSPNSKNRENVASVRPRCGAVLEQGGHRDVRPAAGLRKVCAGFTLLWIANLLNFELPLLSGQEQSSAE